MGSDPNRKAGWKVNSALPPVPQPVYRTKLGAMFHEDSLDLLAAIPDSKVNLILTSPPFALTREKSYGNHPEDEYVAWFEDFAEQFHRVLRDDGSLVIDLGGAWLPGSPTRSLYQYRLLINLVDKFEFHLAEDFYWFNRAKLPGPRQWATIERTRVKDAVNTIWWLSKTPRPKANNRHVLKPYSKAMRRMIERGTYNDGWRPSEHHIGKNWAQDLGGAIPPNVLEIVEAETLWAEFEERDNMLDYANTVSGDSYHDYCRAAGLKRHPARFPRQVPEFFVKFLTDRADWVLDPFGGSNMTGAVAEDLERVWWACDKELPYIQGSLGRFEPSNVEVTSAGLDAGLVPRTE